MSHTVPKAAALDQVADALADIARTADSELTWSDHTCDMALRRIAADAHAALDRLGHAPTTLTASAGWRQQTAHQTRLAGGAERPAVNPADGGPWADRRR